MTFATTRVRRLNPLPARAAVEILPGRPGTPFPPACGAPNLGRPPRAPRAFTLLEVMVAVGIMGIIVAALYTVFNHTQRALRANANQTDVMEGGRFAMALLAADLRGLTAGGWTARGDSLETNFLSTLSPADEVSVVGALGRDLYGAYYVSTPPTDWDGYRPVVQALNARGERRANLLGEVFLFSRTGVRASGVCYRVLNARGGVGTLARFPAEHTNRIMTPGTLSLACLKAPAVSFAPVLEGVVHFQVRPFDAHGRPMTWRTREWYVGSSTNGCRLGYDVVLEREPPDDGTETLAAFRGDALPAAVEVEVGVLEPESLAQFRALPEGSVFAQRFLSNRAAQVQLFRQRIPIWQAPPLQSAQSLRP